MKKCILLLLVVFSSHVFAAEPEQSFVTWLKKGMAQYHIPGVSIAVIKDYKIDWVAGFGMADIKNQRPVTPDTVFQAGSLSKPVTAMAALKAVQEGKISLDANINDALTSWKVPDNKYTKDKKVTLRELLSHSAGINVSGFLGYAAGEKLPTLVEVLRGLPPANSKPIHVIHPVGKKFNYSGGGYTIVQQALIDRYHETFSQVMEQLVLKPLNMTNSTFGELRPPELTNIALPYRPNGKEVQGGPHTYVAKAAAGLWTTPTDLAHFVISIQKSLKGEPNQVLSEPFAKMLAVIPESYGKEINMGLGTLVSLNKNGKAVKNGTYFSHSGQNEGYRNLFFASTQNGNGLVIMTNMSASDSEKPDQGWKFIAAIQKKIVEMNKWK